VPPSVRKGSAFPASPSQKFREAEPREVGEKNCDGKASLTARRAAQPRRLPFHSHCHSVAPTKAQRDDALVRTLTLQLVEHCSQQS
jgi:hypothetical protein